MVIQFAGNVIILLLRLMVIPLVDITSLVCAVEMLCISTNPSEDLNTFICICLF